MICPNCHYNNKDGSKFCKECGYPLIEEETEQEEETIVCPVCGQENPVKAEYCSKCGNNLKQIKKPVYVERESDQTEQPDEDFFGEEEEANPDSSKKYFTIGAIVLTVVLLGAGIFFGISSLKNYKQEQDKVADAVILEEEKEKEKEEQAADKKTAAQNEPKEETEEQTTSGFASIPVEQEESEPVVSKNYTVITEDLPAFSARPVYVGNGHYIYQSNGRYGVIDSSGKIQASDYDAYALREISQTEKQYVDFVGYACVYNEPSETGIDAIELQPCDKNATFPWVQDYSPRVISSSGSIKDLDSGTSSSGNSSLYRQMQQTMTYTVVYESTYNTTGNQDVIPYYLYSEATGTLFGPYNAGEHAFFELKPRLVKTNYFCDTIFYAKENGKYRIYSQDATQSYPELFDYAEPVSDEYMLVKSGNKTGLIDTNFNLVYVDDATDITGADNNKAYAQIDGKWKLIQINSDNGEKLIVEGN